MTSFTYVTLVSVSTIIFSSPITQIDGQPAYELALSGRPVTVQWLPRHNGIEGNEQVDWVIHPAWLILAVPFIRPCSLSLAVIVKYR